MNNVEGTRQIISVTSEERKRKFFTYFKNGSGDCLTKT